MILYVYKPDTRRVVAEFEGPSIDVCEDNAREAGYDPNDREDIAWTYTPAFGAVEGLRF